MAPDGTPRSGAMLLKGTLGLNELNMIKIMFLAKVSFLHVIGFMP